MPKWICDSHGKEKEVYSAKAYSTGHFICQACYSGSSLNKALSILGIIAILILLTGVAQAEDWQLLQHDSAHTGYTNESTADDLELLWSYEVGAVMEVSISSDGGYISAGGYDDTIYFFSRERKLLWKYKTDFIVKSVSISSDGNYIAAGRGYFSHISDEYAEGKLYLFNQDGKLLWSYGFGESIDVERVSISSDGNYIVAGVKGTLYFFNKKGELLWTHENIYRPSISSDGSYVVAGCADGVCFFNRDGKLLWSYEVYDGPYSVSVSSDGSYVTAGCDGKVYFFNRDGKLLWSYQHPKQRERYLFSIDVDAELEEDLNKGIFPERLENIFKSKDIPLVGNFNPAEYINHQWTIGEYKIRKEKGKIDFYRYYSGMHIYYTWISSDGNYVAAKTCGKLYFFNRDGKLLWSYQTEGGSIMGVSISSDGSYVVVGNWGDDVYYDGNIYFFNREGELLWKYKTDTSVESASISSDGSYVTVGTVNKIYCFVGSKQECIMHIINDARSSIDSAKSIGAGTAEAEKLLQQAKTALNEDKYKDAKDYASQAKENAEKAKTMRLTLYGIVIFLIALLFIGYWITARRRERKRRDELILYLQEQRRKEYRAKRKELIYRIDELINDGSLISEKYTMDTLKKMREAIAKDNITEAEKYYKLLDEDLSQRFAFLK